MCDIVFSSVVFAAVEGTNELVTIGISIALPFTAVIALSGPLWRWAIYVASLVVCTCRKRDWGGKCSSTSNKYVAALIARIE